MSRQRQNLDFKQLQSNASDDRFGIGHPRAPHPLSARLAAHIGDAREEQERGMTENDSDQILTRVLGGNMQQATLRMMLFLAVAAAVVATIVVLV